MTNPLGPDFPIADPYTPSLTTDIRPNPAANGQPVDSQQLNDYRFSQLEEDSRRLNRITTEMTAVLEQHSRSLTNLTEAVRALENLNLGGAVLMLDDRLRTLEEAATPPKRDRDDLNDRIVALLESAPTLKFSAISVLENLGGGGKDISDRLKALARNRRIRMFAEQGRRPFYQAIERADAQPS